MPAPRLSTPVGLNVQTQPYLHLKIYIVMQSDGNSWKIDSFHYFWTNDLILILKTPSRPYSWLAKVIICLELV